MDKEESKDIDSLRKEVKETSYEVYFSESNYSGTLAVEGSNKTILEKDAQLIAKLNCPYYLAVPAYEAIIDAYTEN